MTINTYGVDIKADENAQRVFKELYAPALGLLVERLGYYADFKCGPDSVSITISGPFKDVMEWLEHKARAA